MTASLPAGNNTTKENTKIKLHNIKQTTHQEPTPIMLMSRMVPAAHKVDSGLVFSLKEERKEKKKIILSKCAHLKDTSVNH